VEPLELEADAILTPKCVRCGRVRPMPRIGEAELLLDDGETFCLETRKACDWNCPETRVRVRFGLRL